MAKGSWPEEFTDLEKYSDWCLETEQERSDKRQASTFDEIKALYDDLLPRADAILAYLDKYPLEEIPADVRPLLQLTWALAEVAPAIELFGEVQVPDGYDVKRFSTERRGF